MWPVSRLIRLLHAAGDTLGVADGGSGMGWQGPVRWCAVERRAPAEILEEAEIEATLTAHREWVAAGRPGAVSHDEAMAELLSQ